MGRNLNHPRYFHLCGNKDLVRLEQFDPVNTPRHVRSITSYAIDVEEVKVLCDVADIALRSSHLENSPMYMRSSIVHQDVDENIEKGRRRTAATEAYRPGPDWIRAYGYEAGHDKTNWYYFRRLLILHHLFRALRNEQADPLLYRNRSDKHPLGHALYYTIALKLCHRFCRSRLVP